MADVKTHCLQAILCFLVISCRAQYPSQPNVYPKEPSYPNQPNASPNPRVNIDMSRVLGSLVSKLYSNLPGFNAPEESEMQERVPSNTFMQEIKAGRHGSGPLHVYGIHIPHVSSSSRHKLSGAANGEKKNRQNIVDVL